MKTVNIKDDIWKIVQAIGNYFVIELLDGDGFPVGVFMSIEKKECL